MEYSQQELFEMPERFPVGTVLFTKRPRRLGNAVVVYVSQGLYTVQTDFGNLIKSIPVGELLAMWEPNDDPYFGVQDLAQRRRDQLALLMIAYQITEE